MHHVTEEQWDELMGAIERSNQRLADAMPTEQDALRMMQAAYERLKALGWNDAIYCPKDGTAFDVIEVGSSGIHDCHYEGTWPDGSWWVREAGDLWPSRPCLFRLRPAESGASGTDGQGPLSVARSARDEPHAHQPSAEGAVSPWRPIETASEHDVAYKALGIALAALQHIQGMEPITQEITLPTVMAQHAVDALKEIEALGATSCPNPCGECRGVVRAGKCGVCGWEPVP